MRRILSMILVIAFVTALAACAVAEGVTEYVKSNTMKVYALPKASSKVLATLYRGQKVSVVAYSKGWCQLENASGKTGYCKASNLSKTDINSGKCWVINDVACLVHTSSGKTVRVTYGMCFTYVKKEGSKTWIKNRAGEIGYIDSDLVSRTNPFNLYETVYPQVSGKLLLKTAFGKSSAINVSKNTKLTLLSVSPDKTWGAVLYRGKVYYVFHQLLNTEKAPSDGAVCVMQLDDTPVFTKASMTSKILTRLKKGDLVRLKGFVKGYGAKITTQDGVTGYISALPFTIK